VQKNPSDSRKEKKTNNFFFLLSIAKTNRKKKRILITDGKIKILLIIFFFFFLSFFFPSFRIFDRKQNVDGLKNDGFFGGTGKKRIFFLFFSFFFRWITDRFVSFFCVGVCSVARRVAHMGPRFFHFL
jgi:hypothetical protein